MNEEHTPEEMRSEGVGAETEEEENEWVVNLRLPRPSRLLPRETARHLRAAQREMLLAFRSLIDVAVKRLETPEEDQPRRAARIEIR